MPIKAAQYCRMSSESQSYSLEHQKAAIAKYSRENDYQIVRTYEDPGVSGLSLQRRRGLRTLLRDVLDHTSSYEAILVYDVSRWGRFQDVDEAAHYEFLCRTAGVRVVYCAEQFANDGTPTSDLMKAIKRTMAGEYSRELSVRVSAGQRLKAARGFYMNSRAPFGLRRMCVSPSGRNKGLLSLGDHKFHSDNVVLVPGRRTETKIVQEMFERFIKHHGRDEFSKIARELNAKGFKYSTGSEWTRNQVRQVLTTPAYTGMNVWGRRTKLLGGEIVQNPQEKWTTCPNAFKPIVPLAIFTKVQRLIATRWHRRTDEELLSALSKLYKKHGKITRDLMLHSPVGGPSTYSARFGSLSNAYKLVGFQVPRQFEESLQNNRATFAEIEALAIQICSMFPSRVSINRHKECECPILRLNTGETIAIRSCRSYISGYGRTQWKATPWRRPLVSDLVLLALFDTNNSHLTSYYLVDWNSIPDKFCKFRKEHPLFEKAVQLRDLFRFYETACSLIANTRRKPK